MKLSAESKQYYVCSFYKLWLCSVTVGPLPLAALLIIIIMSDTAAQSVSFIIMSQHYNYLSVFKYFVSIESLELLQIIQAFSIPWFVWKTANVCH